MTCESSDGNNAIEFAARATPLLALDPPPIFKSTLLYFSNISAGITIKFSFN